MLKVKNLCVKYSGLTVLDNVTLTVGEGEIVSIVGANGAGKTTLLKSIMGLIPPKLRSGEISFRGVRIDDLPTWEIAKLGISLVPERTKIFPEMTVFENLLVSGIISKKDREENIRYVFSLFNILEERKNQKAGKLSGGERKMLSIGMALMSRPKLLLLDELSLGLAPIVLREILNVIPKIIREGKSILLVEQNVPVSLRISDRGYVIENGKVVLEGEAKQLLKDERLRKAYLGI